MQFSPLKNVIVRVKKSQIETEWLRVTPERFITLPIAWVLVPFFAALLTP